MYKDYIIIVDGYKIGIVSLNPDDVKLLLCDNDIIIKEA